MPMRLQEIHPALVHYPLTLLPAAVGVDALGRMTGNQSLMDFGRRAMPFAAASALVAGVAGLVAQRAVRAEGQAHDELVTHRNLNLGLIGLSAILASKRAGTRQPSLGYLATGLAGLGVMAYTAYLGGKMVYEHGVGVLPANGVLAGQAPELRTDNAAQVAELAGKHLVNAAEHAAEHLAEGEIAPTLTGKRVESHHGGDES